MVTQLRQADWVAPGLSGQETRSHEPLLKLVPLLLLSKGRMGRLGLDFHPRMVLVTSSDGHRVAASRQ